MPPHNPKRIRIIVKRIASPELVDGWLTADAKRRNTQTQFDTLRNEQKRLGELVGKLRRELKAGPSPGLEKLIAEANAIKMQQDALMADLTAAESDCETIMLQLPAIPDPSWPVGRDESENVVSRNLVGSCAFSWFFYDLIPLSNFSGRGMSPVDQYQAMSPYGTFDMAGNAKEWCWNATDNKRFILGGAWNEPTYMFNFADAQSPFDRAPTYGFRCVKYLPGAAFT